MYTTFRSLCYKKIIDEVVRIFLNSVIRKLFFNDVVSDCLSYFNCVVSNAIYRSKRRFLIKLKQSDTVLCILFVTKNADAEVEALCVCVAKALSLNR